MPVITVYRHGGKGGVAPRKNDHMRAIRGEVEGWSLGATRRNTEFLYSIREDRLDGVGFAVTLTLRDCPPTPDAWHRLRKAWTMRMQRAGMVRLHWVTEWQRRGVPHLHGAVWWPAEMVEKFGEHMLKAKMLNDWVFLASQQYRAGFRAQQAHILTGAVGWFQYVSKHAARGVKHYQRSPENVPAEWLKKTGRVWGKWGDWPVQEKLRIDLQSENGDGGWFAYRRLVRSWRVADARAIGDAYRLRQARAMLRCHEINLSRVRGVNEWIDMSTNLTLLAHLASRGYRIKHTDD